jgi:hypothetical protein
MNVEIGTFLKGDTNNSLIYINEYNKLRGIENIPYTVAKKGVLLVKILSKT